MLEWTGERYLPYVDPSISGAEIHYEHLHRYAFTSQFVKGKTVLDLASGEGYGSFILSKKAGSVTGIEIDPDAVNHASETYKKDNLRFLQGSIAKIPIEGKKIFDVIVCFEAIEHIKEHEILLQEIKRLIKDDGFLIISTPNKQTYSDIPNYHNPFHMKEIYYQDFCDLLTKHFANIYLFGQRIYSGSSIFPINSNPNDIYTEFAVTYKKGQFSFKKDDDKMPIYFIAIASEKEFNKKMLQKSYLIDLSDKKNSALDYQISNLNNQNSLLNNHISNLDNQISNLDNQISNLDNQNSLLNNHISNLDNQISVLHNQMNQCINLNQTLKTTLSIKEKQLCDVNIRLTDIEKSIVWQITMKFHHKIIERLLLQNTRRRKYYDLARAGGSILVNNGFREFFGSFKLFKKKDKKLNDYQLWIEKNEPSHEDISRFKRELQDFSYRPKISIITPVWNTDEIWLRLAIESVLNQIYDNWELCIVDGGSTKPHIKRVLNEYARKDSRIKVKFLTENKGIAGNSNEALTLATGDFIGFFDHDDELVPFSLFEIVKLLNNDQNLHFVYSDEDKIDEKGERKDPFFKPDWSPDLFLSCNYLCHFSVIRREILDEIGLFHGGYDGSQDYDLFLRVTERLKDNEIMHIPKILYHWRVIPESAAMSTQIKPYAYAAARKALTDAMMRREIGVEEITDGLWTGSYRVKYLIPSNPKVSIIIPTKDNVKILKQCIQSILDKTSYSQYEIVIVDNQSLIKDTFDYYESINNNPRIRILHYDKPFNFSAINNFAVAHVNSAYILFLNNDTEVISGDWLSAMVEHAQRENVGAVGAKLIYPNNTVQHAGVILGIIGNPPIGGHSHRYFPGQHGGYCGRATIIQNISAVTAACLLMRKEIFERVGGFEEKLAIAFNDVDLCLKIRQEGYVIVFTPYAQLYHHESLSRGYEDTPDKKRRFIEEVQFVREKWGDVIDKGDPYYNPNLTRDKEDFSIKL
jgi:GT2 family glycosyltransferase/SAM-dependent methyltransferase/flagellar biosynthesis chaperone FliJ